MAAKTIHNAFDSEELQKYYNKQQKLKNKYDDTNLINMTGDQIKNKFVLCNLKLIGN